MWLASRTDKTITEKIPPWSTPEWEVFIYLGEPGTNKLHLRPQVGNANGGSSGAPQRAPSKKRSRSAAQEAYEKENPEFLNPGEENGNNTPNNASASGGGGGSSSYALKSQSQVTKLRKTC